MNQGFGASIISRSWLDHFEREEIPVHETRVAEGLGGVWVVVLVERAGGGEVGGEQA